ncbi:hypothetical protein FC83_GL000722 [Agrilactobacillus composti DSM 18527 = JCM 14202]|uniref:Uncharacterized protein n=1 Tax=Agrilactobacillus composti DSM 18527 = JCM 14202 TaxID=1423734 RepID=X0PFB0_9LACO|nr:hypothetical protein [Agrilactobacillus composti]KRM31430.1 hypothetical protein FC83_GL000722 [Agrilactobacillus composti DSM 18527 = JCM 14202]GAF40378.1 hypothetical protein JCM14202_2274 [Agrilactobacillus composti DSM 18527 = JCM 14202]
MLDERLIGEKFVNRSNKVKGTVSFFGVLYHYHIQGHAEVGDVLEVIAVTPLYLLVRKFASELTY